MRGTLNGTMQGTSCCCCCAPPSSARRCCCGQQGAATAGDIAFVLTTFFVLQGYLRDVGMHVRNLQRSVNDMEELVDIHAQPLGIEDRPERKADRESRKGGIRFEHVDVPLRQHIASRSIATSRSTIAPGERVGLVGHSGSGKTTFVKLIQRLYDVNARPHH